MLKREKGVDMDFDFKNCKEICEEKDKRIKDLEDKLEGNRGKMEEQIKEIARHYGYENQSLQLIEEMAELTQALNHLRRYNDCNEVKHHQAVFEEIADVEIMLEQIKHLLNCHDEVETFKMYKVRRQIQRMKESDGKNKCR